MNKLKKLLAVSTLGLVLFFGGQATADQPSSDTSNQVAGVAEFTIQQSGGHDRIVLPPA